MDLKSRNLILLLIIATLSSCIKEYTPENNFSEQKLVAIAEIEANEFAIINLSSTFSSTIPELDIDHDITRISIINYEFGKPNPEEYRYDKDLESYENLTFKPKEGQIYDLEIDVAIEGIPMIRSTTRVPHASNFQDVALLNSANYTNEQGESRTQIEVTLLLEPLKNVNTYYHIVPYILKNVNNTVVKEAMEIASISKGENASFILSHRDGMLIDETKMNNDNDLTFKINSKSPFQIGGTKDTFVYFELRTVTEAYYNFHISLSRQKDSNAGPFTLPVTTYTNIENGYGLFASFSSSLDSLLIE
jgi:hypothetical protein